MSRSETIRAASGAAAVEFALVAPLLGLLLLATADAALFLRTYFRVDRVATELANVMSQHPAGRVSAADAVRYFSGPTALYFTGAQTIAGDGISVTSPPGTTIITVIEGRPETETHRHVVAWQCRRGATSVPSRFGSIESVNPLPGGFVLAPGQTVFVVEVAAPARLWWFSRVFLDWYGGEATQRDTLIYSFAIMRPRVGRLLPAPGVTICP
ncbi:MAG: TadE/TadG family type IV pilus assembly protein [Acetobacteraceae bacterium]